MSKPKSFKEREQEARTERMELEVELLRKQVTEEKPRPIPEPSLGDAEQRARIKKLRLEKEALLYQQTDKYRRQEWIKTLTGAGTLVTATVALLGILFSGYQWGEKSKDDERTRAQERLDRALLLLADKEQAQRLAGVVSLKSFLDREDPSHIDQVLLAFASTLAIEGSLPVRNAIVSALADVDAEAVGKSHLDRALKALCETSRGLMRSGDLMTGRLSRNRQDEVFKETLAKAQSTATAISVTLRNGARIVDMAGIYLGDADISGLSMPGTRFDDSVLERTDFSGSDLLGSSFIGSEFAGARFIAADLRNAVFGLEKSQEELRLPFNFVADRMSDWARFRAHQNDAKELLWIEGPDFRCADLRGADFTGIPIFDMSSDKPPTQDDILVVLGFDFDGANLEGTDFQAARIFGWSNGDRGKDSIIQTGSSTSYTVGEDRLFTSWLRPETRITANGMALHRVALGRLGSMFRATNWQSAKLPIGFSGYLSQLPTLGWRQEQEPAECKPRAPWQYPPEHLGLLNTSGLDWLWSGRACRSMPDGNDECVEVAYTPEP